MLLRTNTPAAATAIARQPQLCRCVSTILSEGSSLAQSFESHLLHLLHPRRPDRLLLLQIPPPSTAHQQRIAFSSRSVGPPSPNLNYLVSRSFIIIGPVRSAIRPSLHSAAAIGTDRTNSIRKDGHANQPIPTLSGTASRCNDLLGLLGRTSSTSPVTPFGKLISSNAEQQGNEWHALWVLWNGV